MNRRLIAYTATAGHGVATVVTDRTRPSYRECREQIPGYVTGRDLGAAPVFTLSYSKGGQAIVRDNLTAEAVERIGAVVMRVSGRTNDIGDIGVVDASGVDVTFNFRCLR